MEFATHSEMRRAIEKLDNTELNGRRVRLIEDKPSKRRHRSALASLIDHLLHYCYVVIATLTLDVVASLHSDI